MTAELGRQINFPQINESRSACYYQTSAACERLKRLSTPQTLSIRRNQKSNTLIRTEFFTDTEAPSFNIAEYGEVILKTQKFNIFDILDKYQFEYNYLKISQYHESTLDIIAYLIDKKSVPIGPKRHIEVNLKTRQTRDLGRY